MRLNSQRARVVSAILSALILISMVLSGVVAGTAGSSPPFDASASARSGVAARTEVGDTTTTQPEDHRVFGKSLTRPNEGMEPQNPGDPGGWLQSSLFFIVCGAVILMVIALSWRSSKLRNQRKLAGYDPVDLAKQRGEGVRAPSPLEKH